MTYFSEFTINLITELNILSSADEHAEQIYKSLETLANATCIKFVNHTNEIDFVTVSGDTKHCSSKVGRRGGEQFVKLVNRTVGEGCFKVASVIHEFVHTLGFYHIHKGADRDNHVRIIWENVIPAKKHKLLIKAGYNELTDFGVGYDYDSIMHYSGTAFSVNGKVTIETVDGSWNSRIGQRQGLSKGDVDRINRMYECH